MESLLHDTTGFNDEDGEMDMDIASTSTSPSAGSARSRAFDAAAHANSLQGSFDSPSTPPCEPPKPVSITTTLRYPAKPGGAVASENAKILVPAVEEYVNKMKAYCRTLPPPPYNQHQNARPSSSEEPGRRGIYEHDQVDGRQRLSATEFSPASVPGNLSIEFTPTPELDIELETRVSEGIRRFQASLFHGDIDFSASNDHVPDFFLDDYCRSDFSLYGAEQPDTNQNEPNNGSEFLAQNLPPLGSDFEYANYIYGDSGSQRGSINGDEHSPNRVMSRLEFERRINKARFFEARALSAGYALRNGENHPFYANVATKHAQQTSADWIQKCAEWNQKAIERGRENYDETFRHNLGIASIGNRPNLRSLYDSTAKDQETCWDSDIAGGFNADDREYEGDIEGGFGDSDEERDSDATIYEEEE